MIENQHINNHLGWYYKIKYKMTCLGYIYIYLAEYILYSTMHILNFLLILNFWFQCWQFHHLSWRLLSTQSN